MYAREKVIKLLGDTIRRWPLLINYYPPTLYNCILRRRVYTTHRWHASNHNLNFDNATRASGSRHKTTHNNNIIIMSSYIPVSYLCIRFILKRVLIILQYTIIISVLYIYALYSSVAKCVRLLNTIDCALCPGIITSRARETQPHTSCRYLYLYYIVDVIKEKKYFTTQPTGLSCRMDYGHKKKKK